MNDMTAAEISLESLFEQLGLASDACSRTSFIVEHGPIPAAVSLADAECWNASQKAFIEESIAQDAEWAPVVGQLDALLRN